MRMRDIPQIGSTRFARLRRAVPTGGRRSKRSPRLKRGGVPPSAQKTTAANFVRCLRDRGESVQGGLPPPLHIPERGESRAPQARKGVSIPEPGAAGRRILRPQPLLLRGLRAALAALRKPELRTEGRRILRPQPLLLRGLRAALAALRKPELRTEGRRILRPQPLLLRGLRAAPAALRKPELRTAGRRILRPQPLLLRGLRAALAALRKAGAKRRAVPGRGPNSKQDYDRKLFQIKAPSGNRSS